MIFTHDSGKTNKMDLIVVNSVYTNYIFLDKNS